MAMALRFLDYLHARLDERHDGLATVLFMRLDGSVIVQRFAPGVSNMPHDSRLWGRNVFMTVATFAQTKAKTALLAVPALWVDIDPPKEGDLRVWQSRTRQRIATLALKPSLVVFSGRGWHLYWLLEKPLRISDYGSREQVSATVELINRRLAKSLGADSSHDVSRVLRWPGTTNLKNGELCRIEYPDEYAQPARYELDDVCKFAGADLSNVEGVPADVVYLAASPGDGIADDVGPV